MTRSSARSSVRSLLPLCASPIKLHVASSTEKERERVDKKKSKPEAQAISADALREALEKIRKEDLPASSEEKEQYFMAQVGIGETLATEGRSLTALRPSH